MMTLELWQAALTVCDNEDIPDDILPRPIRWELVTYCLEEYFRVQTQKQEQERQQGHATYLDFRLQ